LNNFFDRESQSVFLFLWIYVHPPNWLDHKSYLRAHSLTDIVSCQHCENSNDDQITSTRKTVMILGNNSYKFLLAKEIKFSMQCASSF